MKFLKNFCLILFPFLTASSTKIEAPESKKECLDVCTEQYNPVCATKDICYKSFSNSCVLSVANCLAKQSNECLWYEVPASYCECPTQCAYTYSPVCAVSTTEITLFASECSMLETECLTGENYIMLPWQVCIEYDDPTECAIVCPNDYNPICAFDGYRYETFYNQCDLNVRNCYQDYVWAVHSFGDCPDCLIEPYYNNVVTVY